MRHKDMILHLYESRCSVCCDIAKEFERIIKKNWELKQVIKEDVKYDNS